MPSDSFDLGNPEELELLGQPRAAMRRYKRELDDLEKQMARIIEQGNFVDPRMIEKAKALRGSVAKNRTVANEDRELKREVRKSVSAYMARLMNTHNPHGRLRMMMNGNVNAGVFHDIGRGLRTAGVGLYRQGYGRAGRALSSFGGNLGRAALRVGGVGFMAGLAAHKYFDMAQQGADNAGAAAKAQGQFAGQIFEEGRQYRHIGGEYAGGRVSELQELNRTDTIDALSAAWGPDLYGLGDVRGFRKEQIGYAKQRKAVTDWHRKYRGVIKDGALAEGQSAAWLYSQEVEKKLRTVKEAGYMGWARGTIIKNRGVIEKLAGVFGMGGTSGVRIGLDNLETEELAERKRLAVEMAEKARKSVETQLADEKKAFFENPVSVVAQNDLLRSAQRINDFDISRNLDWNQN